MTRNEDVFPIENGDIPASDVSLPEGMSSTCFPSPCIPNLGGWRLIIPRPWEVRSAHGDVKTDKEARWAANDCKVYRYTQHVPGFGLGETGEETCVLFLVGKKHTQKLITSEA